MSSHHVTISLQSCWGLNRPPTEPIGACSLILEDSRDKGGPGKLWLSPGSSHSILQGLPKVTAWEDSLQSRCLQNAYQGNL